MSENESENYRGDDLVVPGATGLDDLQEARLDSFIGSGDGGGETFDLQDARFDAFEKSADSELPADDSTE